jgi:hypothetical protein
MSDKSPTYIVSYTWASFTGRKTKVEKHYSKKSADRALEHLERLAKERPNGIQDITLNVIDIKLKAINQE